LPFNLTVFLLLPALQALPLPLLLPQQALPILPT
jgi:hypothetical protein